jgi:hypothetical protein
VAKRAAAASRPAIGQVSLLDPAGAGGPPGALIGGGEPGGDPRPAGDAPPGGTWPAPDAADVEVRVVVRGEADPRVVRVGVLPVGVAPVGVVPADVVALVGVVDGGGVVVSGASTTKGAEPPQSVVTLCEPGAGAGGTGAGART